jgi:hypothetical protein
MLIENFDQLINLWVVEASQSLETYFPEETGTPNAITEKSCIIHLDKGTLKIQAPHSFQSSDGSSAAIESTVGSKVEFVEQFYDDSNTGKAIVFSNETKLIVITDHINLLQSCEQPSYRYEITFTDTNGNISSIY